MGHHMEWVAFAPPDSRPSAVCLKKALRFIVRNAPLLADSAVQEYYHLLTHVGRAICHFAGIEPTSAYKLFV